MTADTLYSRTITNLSSISGGVVDAAVGPTYDNAGFNIAARVENATDYCTPTAAGLADTTSKYWLVRLRSNVKLRSMKVFVSTALDTNGTPLLTWDFGAYYSNSTKDGTQAILQGTLISATVFGGTIVSPATAKVPGATTFFAAAPADMDKMLWDFLGLSSDPGGYIDVVAKVHAAAATAATGDLGVLVDFVE